MKEKAKLNRDDQKAQKAPAKPHEQAGAAPEAVKAPDLPALGAGGGSLGGGLGSAVDQAENDPAKIAEDQKEMARVQALPAGDPELETYKKPEAMGAKVPEGGGATGAAKGDAQGMSPKEEAQAPASLGPSTEQVSKEMGGAKIDVQAVEVYQTPPSSGPAAQAVSLASTPPAAGPQVSEVSGEAAAEPAQKVVAAEAVATKEPEQPTQLNTAAPSVGEVAVASAEPAKAPVGQPEAVKTGDASAEGKAGSEPEKAPTEEPRAVAGQVDAAPAGAEPVAPDAGEAAGAQVAELAVPQGVAPPVAEGQVAGGSAEVAAVPVAAVPDALSGSAAPAAEAAVAEAAPASLQADATQVEKPAGGEVAAAAEVTPGAAAVAAPEVVAGAEIKPGSVEVPAGSEAAPALATGGDVAVAGGAPAVVAEASAVPVGGQVEAAPQGNVPAPSVGAAPEAAREDVSAGGGAPATVGAGAAPTAPTATAGPAAPVVAPTAEPAVAGAEVDGAAPEVALPGGELSDPFAGRIAAEELGSQVFGLTADQAGEQAKLAPEAQSPDALAVVAKVSDVAGKDPSAELGQEAAEQKKQIDTLLKGKGEVPKMPAMPKGLDGLGKAGQSALGELKGAEGAMGDLLGKGKDAAADLKKGAQDGVEKAIGKGKSLAGGAMKKAEKATGVDLSDVKVHEGKGAEALADEMGAEAFTEGKNIVLGGAAKLSGAGREVIEAEEAVHAASMKKAAGTVRTGVSSAVDKSEKSVRSAAKQVLEGADVKHLLADDDRKAIYRNDGAAATGVKMPDKVQVSIGGKSISVSIPKMTTPQPTKQVSLPSLGITGLTISSMALMRFDTTTGKFKGGMVDGAIAVGTTLTKPIVKISIAESGEMTSSFTGAALKVGSLVDATITANVGAAGVTGTGTLRHSDLKGAKLTQWLKSGSLPVTVAADGSVSASGSLGFQVEPFTAGTLQASIVSEQLEGSISITNANEIQLPPRSNVGAGTLTGSLNSSDTVELSGSLALKIESLGGGEGTLAATWDSTSEKLAGAAALTSNEQSALGKVIFTKASVTGTAADGKLDRVEGSGEAKYNDLFQGNWNGSLDLTTNKASFTLGGKLVAPIIQGEVQVAEGTITLQVDNSELTSTSGNVDFKLGSFMKGTAVLEEGTTANNINATATAELVSTQTFGDVALSKGSVTVKVRGTQIEVVSGSVDMTYRDVAKGQLNLSASADYRKFNGNGKATLNEGLQWVDIKVLSGDIDIDLQQNVVQTAQGQMKMEYKESEGQMSFDAKNDFNNISGTATAKLTAPVSQVGALSLIVDSGKSHDMKFVGSAFTTYKGAFGWQYEKFTGDVAVTSELADMHAVSGKGKADLHEWIQIAAVDGKIMKGLPGSDLTGKIEGGMFRGVKGTLKWEYDGWLGGDASIPVAKTSIENIDGTLAAQVTAPHQLPGTKVEIQPGGASALSVVISNSTPQRYSGTLEYIYDKFLKGKVTVSGDMLDFSNLQGTSVGEVIEPKLMKNVEVQTGSSLNVVFQDSDFTTFTGNVQYKYKDWLKGAATAEAVSSMTVGVVAKNATGTLLKEPPGGNGDFHFKEGGSAIVDLSPGIEVTEFKAGSTLNWDYKEWIGGDMTLTTKAGILSPNGTSSASILNEKLINASPALSLLPSSGVNTAIAMGHPTKLTGSVNAKIEDWVSGVLAIGQNSTVATFNGNLTGALIKDKPLEGTPTTLTAGGNVTVAVLVNSPDSISGTVPFKYGEGGDFWMTGSVVGRSGAGSLKSLSGPTTGTVSTAKELGSTMTLKTGGALAMPMTNAFINRLGGTINWQSNERVAGWIGGTATGLGASTPALISGDYAGAILKDYPAGLDVTLKPGGGLTGKIAQNSVTTVAGPVNFEYSTWLKGSVNAREGAPAQITGDGRGSLFGPKEIIPGQLSLLPGGDLAVKLGAGSFKKLSGKAKFRWETWLEGTVDLAETDLQTVNGTAKAKVVGPGKTFGSGMTAVKLLPGGSLTMRMANDGVHGVTGKANVEFGQSGPDTWHLKGTGQVENSEPNEYLGTIKGALASERVFQPNLTIKKDGSAGGRIAGGQFTEINGKVNYEYKRDAQPFVAGSLDIAAGSSNQSLSGTIDGTIVKESVYGDVKILPGGKLNGTLTNNNSVTLGGNLQFMYKTLMLGKVELQGQLNEGGQVNGRAEATSMGGQAIGPMNVMPGSKLGATIANSAVTKMWGKLNFTSTDFIGVVEVPEGDSTPTSVSGDAKVTLIKDKAVGSSGLKIRGGTSLSIGVEANEFKKITGSVDWAYKDWLTGNLTVEGDASLETISGSGQATLAKKLPVGGTGMSIIPGTSIGAKIAGGNLDSVSGKLLWEYDASGWLGGDVTVPEGTKIDSPSGSGTAVLKQEKTIGELALTPGGSLTVQVAAGEPSSFGGKVMWEYGADRWLKGDVTIAEGSQLSSISGAATATLAKDKMVGGSQLKVLKGGSLTMTMANSQPGTFDGEVNWEYEDWLAGKLTVTAATIETIQGDATASLKKEHAVGGGALELQKGGSAQVHVGNSAVEEFGGTVNWKYGEGEKWAEGSLTVAGKSSFDSIAGKAEAHLLTDLPLGEVTVLKDGSSVQAEIAGSAIKTFGGTVGFRYDQTNWLEGSIKVDPGSTREKISGEATATVKTPYNVAGTELNIDTGSTAKVAVANNEVKTFGGNLKWTYGADPWLKGTIQVADGSTPKKITGKVTATLTKNYILSEKISLGQGGNLTADFDGTTLKSFNGEAKVFYEDWIEGSLKLTNSNLDQVNGTLTAKLIADKALDDKLTLKRGGSAQVTVANNAFQSFTGEVNWQYEQWLEGSMTVTAGKETQISGTASATIKEAKQVGEGGKLEIQRGSSVQAKVTNNALDGIGGDIAWKYEDWLKGTVTVPPYAKLDKISGTVTATLATNKDVGSEITLIAGGNVRGQLENGSLSKIGGQVEWRYQDWLKGSVTLNDGPLDHLVGKASASITKRKDVSPPFSVVEGSIQVDFDSKKSLGEAPFSGNLVWEYDSWLGGSVTVNAGSTFANLNGDAVGVLKQEKILGDVTLLRGGNVRVKVLGSKPDSFGGDLNWKYQDWLGGTIAIADGSKLDTITGKGTASVLADKPLGDFTLKAGGSVEANLDAGNLTTFGGTVYYQYKDLFDGSLEVAKSSTKDSITGKGTASLMKPVPVGGSEFIIQPGSSASVDIANSQFTGITGNLNWKYQAWAEGGIEVQTSKLDSISGKATARIVGEKEFGKFKLLPGGSASVQVTANELKKWGGTVNWQYDTFVRGALSIQGEQDLASIKGEATARLIEDYNLPAGNTKLMSGSSIGVKLANANIESFQGAVRFQHDTWLAGSIELTESTPSSINGHASAMLIEAHKPGGGAFELKTGGNVQVDFANSAFTDIEGQLEWAFDDPRAKLAGNITVPKSPITAINGNATARLTADTAPVQETVLKAGGQLNVKVAASSPESFGGRIDWQHSNWIGGYVEMPKNTSFAGPYTGRAGAVLKDDKQFGSKILGKKGGQINMELDSSNVAGAQIDGRVAFDYDNWVRGSLTVDPGSSFTNLSGMAKVELLESKPIGGSGLKLLAGGNAEARFAANELTTFGGVLMMDYEDWLTGSIVVDPASTLESITGRATVQLKADKVIGEFTLLSGGQLTVDVAGSKLGGIGGLIDWKYQSWIQGNLTVETGSKLDSIRGQGSARIIAEKQMAPVTLLEGGNATVKVANSAVTSFGGEVRFRYEDWLEGGVMVAGESDMTTLSGQVNASTTKAKDVGGDVTIKQGSAVQAQMEASALTSVSGTLGFEWAKTIDGTISVSSGSTLTAGGISGSAQIGLMKDVPVGAGVKLVKGGNAQVDFSGSAITSMSGQLSLEYDSWLKGTITVNPGSTLSSVSGNATLSVSTAKTFGAITIKEGSSLAVDFANNTVTEFRGNVEVTYEDWLKGNLNFKAQDLSSISGSGSLEVTQNHLLVEPVSILQGSYIKVNFANSALKDFGGTAKIGVTGWGKGELTINDGSTPSSVSGSGKVQLDQPKKMGEHVTLTSAMLGADFENNTIKSIYGEAQAEVKDFGNGWVKIDRSSTLTSFTGQAGLALTTPKPIGSFAELSGGKILANFEANALKDFGGKVDIKVFGWGKGSVEISAGSTLDHIKGSAELELEGPKSLAGGKVLINRGKVSGSIDGQKLTRIAGDIEVELAGIAKGEVKGELDVEQQKFSGSGKLTQIKPWVAGPVKIHDASLSATITDNKLTGAAGKASIDAGKFGKGTFEVNYEDVGGEPKFYGKGEIQFKPHDRIKGTLKVNFSRDQKFTGEGIVDVKISDKINGQVGVALDDQGHVKIKGSVTIPGPFELFTPKPYKKDMKLLDLSFVVYTPPTVKVKVGAGLGIECGIKPLTLSNLVLAGECDLMEPSFASMSVSGHLASSAYCDLNAYVEGSVAVSAAVVAVEAGLRAALNLHLEASLSADPTITVNRNGLSFDMPVDARLSAALNLVLTFFAKVRVGLDLGLFSIMKTVWRYEKSPDPLRLAEMSIGAKGRVRAGPGGFSAEMNPEYTPPDLSLDSLKRALGL